VALFWDSYVFSFKWIPAVVESGTSVNFMNSGPNQHQQSQVPPPETSVVALAPTPRGGAKPWIIMSVLVGLIGLGLWLVTGMEKGEEEATKVEKEETKVEKVAPRAKPRKAEKTTDRPLKSEMANLSSKNRGAYEKNVGKWVNLKGEIQIGNKDGVLIFKEPVKMRGQLVKGSAEHLTGELVKIVGWMVSEEKIQIDGIFDISVVDPIDLLPKKDVYTIADAEQLVSLRHTKATFEGKVQNVRVSDDEKKLHLIFEGGGYQVYGSGLIEKLKKEEVTEDTLKELIGKTIKLTGKLEYKKMPEAERILINFEKKDSYEVVE
jgi:hypothetical protein